MTVWKEEASGFQIEGNGERRPTDSGIKDWDTKEFSEV